MTEDEKRRKYDEKKRYARPLISREMNCSDPALDEVDQILKEIAERERCVLATIRTGDLVYGIKQRQYSRTGFQYFTQRKGYRVHHVRGERICCKTDIIGEHDYVDPLEVTHFTRDGEIVWDHRDRVAFCYKLDENSPSTDQYGFKLTEKLYTGIVSDYHYDSESRNNIWLVELLEDFRDGKKGDLAMIDPKKMHTFYLVESNGYSRVL